MRSGPRKEYTLTLLAWIVGDIPKRVHAEASIVGIRDIQKIRAHAEASIVPATQSTPLGLEVTRRSCPRKEYTLTLLAWIVGDSQKRVHAEASIVGIQELPTHPKTSTR